MDDFAAAPAAERSLPHNLEAERCVLGSILINNSAFNVAAELVKADDFYRDAHRRIFDKLIGLSERGQALDLVTLREELDRAGDLEKIGGPAYISALADGVPRSTNVAHYAQIVKEKAVLRSVIHAGNKIVADAYAAAGDADDVLDRAQQELFAIAEGRVHRGFVSMEELVRDGIETVERIQAQEGSVTGVPTGFIDVDGKTAGLQPADLVIVAARPSMGKTAFALNIGMHVGRSGERSVGIFSLEMAREQIFLRLLTAEASVDAHRLRDGTLSDSDMGRLSEALGSLGQARVFIDDSPGIGVLEMRAKSRLLKETHGLDLLIIDYIQLMQGRGRFDNRALEIASISRNLKGLAKELNVPVVALSQLNRAPEASGDHRPQLSHLRESGALEQDADVVMFIFREEMYDPKPENEGLAEIIVGKQRNGPTGTVKLAFLKQYTRFDNLSTAAEP